MSNSDDAKTDRVTSPTFLGPGLMTYRGQPWTRGKCVTEGRVCVFSGKPIPKGAQVYSPLGNTKNRYERILASEVEQ